MRNIDDLVRKSERVWPKTFKDQREAYNELTNKIEVLLKEKKTYDLLVSEDNSLTDETNFKNTLDLYNLAKRPDQQNENLVEYLFKIHPELKAYVDLCHNISETREMRNKILSENIYFNNFADESLFNETCFKKHYLVKIEDNLVCMCCGAKTQDFAMSKEDVEFLERCAEKQGIFLKEVTEKDMPLLKLLLEERKEREITRTPIEEIEENSIMGHMDWAEEYYLEDEAVISDMRRTIKHAQMLDAGIFETENYRVGNPKYLTLEQTEILLERINNQISILEYSSSKDRDLQLEICRTYKYEVLILSGNRIPILYAEAKNEEEQIALVKAYYNISNSDYRINSGYFNPDHRNNDANFYTCITAQPEINEKLFEMKLKR